RTTLLSLHDALPICFAALEMLRKQAASRPAGEDTASRRAAAKALIHKNLLSAMHYLAEFAKELNGVLPTTERPYGFIHLHQVMQDRKSTRLNSSHEW